MGIYRGWINQPSTHQQLHNWHGRRCIVNDLGGQVVDIYFTEGATHSMRVPRSCIEQCHLSDAE